MGKNNNEIGIWAITPGGGKLGLELAEKLGSGADFYISEWLGRSSDFKIKGMHKSYHYDDRIINIFLFQSLAKKIKEKFSSYSGHVFIFSTGIAVRVIAPLLQSKLKDPAVVVMDDRGRHAISLVSGHIGNANALTEKIAELMGADPVITTATDINELPAIDVIAKQQGLIIENPGMIKNINMAFLKNEKICIIDPYNIISPFIPESFWQSKGVDGHGNDIIKGALGIDKDNGFFSILCSDEIIPVSRETLVLRPPSLVIGIGCNRNTSLEEMEGFIGNAFHSSHLSVKSITLIASSDIKRDEQGLLKLAEKMQLAIKFYSKDQLNSVENIKNPSEMVEKHIGVKSVCEAAAILASKGGKLIVPKVKKGNATLAVARKPRYYL